MPPETTITFARSIDDFRSLKTCPGIEITIFSRTEPFALRGERIRHPSHCGRSDIRKYKFASRSKNAVGFPPKIPPRKHSGKRIPHRSYCRKSVRKTHLGSVHFHEVAPWRFRLAAIQLFRRNVDSGY